VFQLDPSVVHAPVECPIKPVQRPQINEDMEDDVIRRELNNRYYNLDFSDPNHLEVVRQLIFLCRVGPEFDSEFASAREIAKCLGKRKGDGSFPKRIAVSGPSMVKARRAIEKIFGFDVIKAKAGVGSTLSKCGRILLKEARKWLSKPPLV
jgi:hypothetical protein